MSMSGPTWLADIFAALMLLVAAYSTAHLAGAQVWSRRTHVDVDLVHIAMGVAMAGMLVADLNPIGPGVWETVFIVLGVWFVWRCYAFVAKRGVTGRDEDHVHHLSHYATHLVMSMAMLYMYFAATTPAHTSSGTSMAMAAPTDTTTDFVGLPLLFLFVLLVSGMWELDGAQRFAQTRSVRNTAPRSPALVGAGDAVPGSSGPLPAQGRPPAAGSPDRAWLTPGLEAGAHIAMCVTMAYMLILML